MADDEPTTTTGMTLVFEGEGDEQQRVPVPPGAYVTLTYPDPARELYPDAAIEDVGANPKKRESCDWVAQVYVDPGEELGVVRGVSALNAGWFAAKALVGPHALARARGAKPPKGPSSTAQERERQRQARARAELAKLLEREEKEAAARAKRQAKMRALEATVRTAPVAAESDAPTQPAQPAADRERDAAYDEARTTLAEILGLEPDEVVAAVPVEQEPVAPPAPNGAGRRRKKS